MKSEIADALLITRLAPRMGGVFSSADLKSVFDCSRPVIIKRRVDRLIAAGVLARYARGHYVAPGFDAEVLAMRLGGAAYLSLGTALAKHLMIGALPARTVHCVCLGRRRDFQGAEQRIRFYSLAEDLFFGYENRGGVNIALPEKALLDTLYFHLRGHRFSFDLYQDLNLSVLNRGRLERQLRRFKNPRFRRFVRNYLDDRL